MTTDFLAPPLGWMSSPAARLPAPPPSARGPLFRSASKLSGWFGRQQVPDIIATLHINPGLFWPWLLFASRLMPFGRLDARTREKIILRTAWNCRSRYEWGQHVEIALRVGVTDDDIVRLTTAPETLSDAVERALMSACDQLCQNHQIHDDTWATLTAAYNEKRMIEVVLLIGHYQMIAGFLNTSGLRLEPPIEATLQAFYQRVAASAPAR